MTKDNDTSRTTSGQEISGEMLEILKIITFEENASAEDLATRLNISKPKARYYLDVLIEKKFVEEGMMATGFFPTKEGRKYMFDNNLL
jgi:predicted ArsR family transcriptional regulator